MPFRYWAARAMGEKTNGSSGIAGLPSHRHSRFWLATVLLRS